MVRCKFLALLCIGLILWFTVQPVEMSWCETDIRLTDVICVVALVAVVVFIWRKQQMSLSFIDIVVALWFAYVMLMAYVNPAYPCANFCLRTMQMFSLYMCVRLLFSSVRVSERMMVFAILICAIYEAVLGVGQIFNGSSRHYLYLLTGSFLNPGPYSAILAMALVMALQWKKIIEDLPFLSSFFYIPIIIFAILLPATWSRAALLATAICAGIIYWNQWKRWRWWIFVGMILVMTGLYFLKQGSADGRSIIYLISVLSISHNPIWGSGIGSFCHQYAEEMAHFSSQHPTFNFLSADITSSAYNCLLQIGVEQGIIGSCFALTLVLMMLVRLKKKGKTLGIGLLCLLFFSMFSYPFNQLPYQIIFVLIAAYAGTGEEKIAVLSTKWHKWSRSYLAPVAMLGSVTLLSVFIHQQIRERVKAESDYRMMSGLTNAAFLNDYYEMLPLLAENRRFLFDFAKLLAQQGRYNDSNAILRQGTLVSNDPMFFVLQGNNYKGMEDYAEAEATYQKAYSILPNRIYPLYQLMCLYEQMGNPQKMKQMAKRVFEFNVKVESPATREMKENARQRLIEK